MAAKQIAVEGNLTSNVQTMTTPDYRSHPGKIFLEHNILFTLNTDDPGISGIDLRYEYEVAAPAAGFTPSQIRQMQMNALEAAFLDAEQKDRIWRQAQSRGNGG
jgi:adenosine deaminase